MFIGIDIGTTNVKAVAVNESGMVCAVAERRNHIMTFQAGWSEQDPEALFQNVRTVLDEVMQQPPLATHAEQLHGIAFSAAMHGIMAVDTTGHPLTNVWLWSDLRADGVARDLRARDGLALYRQTGVPVHAMSPLCKLIWMRENQPEIFHRAHKFLGIKEYVWYRLTGRFESDWSCASATGLLNIWRKEWDVTALSLAGIAADKLPGLVSPAHQAPLADGPAGSAIRLTIGASDGACANLGSDATGPGQLAITIGTSAAIRGVTATPFLDDAMRTFCYRLDEQRFISGGASNNGTNALEWLRASVFQSPKSPEAFANQASDIAPGSEGLTFLPYVQGERAPLWDAQARGAFQGLNVRHSQAHFIRAAMEGILFNLKIIAASMHLPHTTRMLHASGGFSHNVLWVQMLADIFQTPVAISDNGADASVFGAIQLGRSATGLNPIERPRQQNHLYPRPEHAKAYQEAFDRFRHCLQSCFTT